MLFKVKALSEEMFNIQKTFKQFFLTFIVCQFEK